MLLIFYSESTSVLVKEIPIPSKFVYKAQSKIATVSQNDNGLNICLFVLFVVSCNCWLLMIHFKFCNRARYDVFSMRFKIEICSFRREIEGDCIYAECFLFDMLPSKFGSCCDMQ